MARCDAREFAEWIALAGIEPWGEYRGDIRAGIVAAATVNIWAGKNKGASITDFLPDWDASERRQTPDEMKAILKGLEGGKDAKRRNVQRNRKG